MSIFEAKASQIVNDIAVESQNPFQFDPTIILVIIEVIMKVISALRNCNIGEDRMLEILQTPSTLQKLRLQRFIREANKGSLPVTNHQIYQGCCNVAKSTTLDELKQLNEPNFDLI